LRRRNQRHNWAAPLFGAAHNFLPWLCASRSAAGDAEIGDDEQRGICGKGLRRMISESSIESNPQIAARLQ
jgi:hypothetical protein